ncbi:zincin-like metalloprotease [Artemisia annua]|uniref:Zincin-like metalloprotease n=1 Tax=Artemisia annua TaxID=35608 RepID=A0A2U1PQX9_ARTAN|nr:zincin-like metalloprotease [Artemisia annua]
MTVLIVGYRLMVYNYLAYLRAILQFFIDYGEFVLHDADPSLRTFFRSCLSRDFADPVVAESTLSYLFIIHVALLVAQVKNEVQIPGYYSSLKCLNYFMSLATCFWYIDHLTLIPSETLNARDLLPINYSCFNHNDLDMVMLMDMCYEEASLRLISGFHQDITKPITDDVCKSLNRWRCSFSALKLKVMLGLPMLEGTILPLLFPVVLLAVKLLAIATFDSEYVTKKNGQILGGIIVFFPKRYPFRPVTKITHVDPFQ